MSDVVWEYIRLAPEKISILELMSRAMAKWVAPLQEKSTTLRKQWLAETCAVKKMTPLFDAICWSDSTTSRSRCDQNSKFWQPKLRKWLFPGSNWFHLTQVCQATAKSAWPRLWISFTLRLFNFATIDCETTFEMTLETAFEKPEDSPLWVQLPQDSCSIHVIQSAINGN